MLNIGDKKVEEAILSIGQIKEIPADTIILSKGQYVKVVPVVIKGLIKVYIEHEDKDFLLYYIKPGQSCILSFSAALKDQKSQVYAKTVEPTTALLLPAFKLKNLVREHTSLLFWYTDLYYNRYNELIQTFEQVIFQRLDQRLYTYLQKKSSTLQQNPIKVTHREIAEDLGTAREVVSRILKRLERDNKVAITSEGIKIL